MTCEKGYFSISGQWYRASGVIKIIQLKRVLFIAHYFPPIGGAGVQRSAKFVKHLPEFGILPLVLTGSGKERSHWSPEDLSLLADVPSGVPVFRVNPVHRNGAERTRELLALGDRIIASEKPALILVTMSPFEDALIAAELSRRHGIPWVADLRDPWALDEFQVYRTFWHRLRERRRMAAYLASASSIIMNTPEAAKRFREAFPRLAGKAHVAITNGYDAEEFPSGSVAPRNSRFTLVHSGYLHTEEGLRQARQLWLYRLLGRTEPGMRILPRSHYYLMQALERWQEEDPAISDHFRAVFIGVPSRADEELVRKSSARALVSFTGYLPHVECVQRVSNADVVFLPMHQVPPKRRSSIVPGKTYEYMAARRSILAAVPEGDARDFLSAAGTVRICGPADIDGMLSCIKDAYQEWQTGKDVSGRWNKSYVERFERRTLCKQLADELTRGMT